MQQAVRIIYGDLDADTRLSGNDQLVHVAIVLHVAHHGKGVAVFQPVDEFAAFAAAVGVIDHRGDAADVGIDAEA